MTIINKQNIKWLKYQSVFIPETAPHISISTSKKEIKQLRSKNKALIARWVSDWDCTKKTEFWAIIKDNFGGMDELSTKMRNQVKKATKNCIVKKIDKDFIKNNGYKVYLKAFSRYDNYLSPTTEKEFKNSIECLGENWDFWGVFEKNNPDKLIAYSQNWIFDNTSEYKVIKLDPDYLKLYPSYALIYEMNRYYLEELNFKYVNDGYRSIAHQTNIQDFLIQKFKFRKAYCKLNVIYDWKVKAIISILYPFRHLIKKINYRFIKKVSTLLFLEQINKSFLNEK